MKHHILICLIFLLSSCQTNKTIPSGLPTGWEHPFCLASFQTKGSTKKLYFTKHKGGKILVDMTDDEKPIKPPIDVKKYLMNSHRNFDTRNWQQLRYVYHDGKKEFCISSMKLNNVPIIKSEVANNNNSDSNENINERKGDELLRPQDKFFPNRKVFYDLSDDEANTIFGDRLPSDTPPKIKSEEPKLPSDTPPKIKSEEQKLPLDRSTKKKLGDLLFFSSKKITVLPNKTLELGNVHHVHLAPYLMYFVRSDKTKMKEDIAAGEIFVKDGKVVWFDNISGYRMGELDNPAWIGLVAYMNEIYCMTEKRDETMVRWTVTGEKPACGRKLK